jgi:hypothetical protein
MDHKEEQVGVHQIVKMTKHLKINQQERGMKSLKKVEPR